MATKKSKKKQENKLGKAKAIVKKLNNDLIDASFNAIETTVKTGEKWQKLTAKLVKKAEPLTKQQINMVVETAESIKGQLETSTDRLKVLVGYDPKMVETAKKMVTEHPLVEKAEEMKDKIEKEVSNNKLVKKAEKMSAKLKKNISETIEEVKEKIEDYTVWLGVDINNNLLKEITELPLAFILRNSNLDAYLKLLSVYDNQGKIIDFTPLNKLNNKTKEHYFDTILQYYQNYFHTLKLPKERTKQSLLDKFGDYFFEGDIEEFNADLFWIKIVLPVAFTETEIEKLDVKMNTFPVVNRKLQYKQHSISRNGKIASLRTVNNYFLNVESLIDNEGRAYNNTLSNDINNLKGTYSLYFGELEQFDERNAKAILEQVIQTVREEGSSFSAIGYDLLNAYLEDLNEKLDIIERKVNSGYKNVSSNSNRQYLLTIPFEDSAHLECQFWTTDADEANNIERGKVLGQFHTGELIPQSIRLQTDTIGGSIKNDVKEKISNLRYGLLSKDRIVSAEDVKEFVRKNVGKTVDNVEVSSGVSISPNKKEGLIRTTQVNVYLTNNTIYTSENKKRLGSSLQLELEQKSVHNLPYNVSIF